MVTAYSDWWMCFPLIHDMSINNNNNTLSSPMAVPDMQMQIIIRSELICCLLVLEWLFFVVRRDATVNFCILLREDSFKAKHKAIVSIEASNKTSAN